MDDSAISQNRNYKGKKFRDIGCDVSQQYRKDNYLNTQSEMNQELKIEIKARRKSENTDILEIEIGKNAKQK